MGDRIELVWRRVWDHRRVVQGIHNMLSFTTLMVNAHDTVGRVVLSRCIHLAKHSRHVLFALKLATGMSLLALPAFLPPGYAGRKWFESSRGAWTVLSYMYVLEVHTGATLRVGLFRMIGTFSGAVAAYIVRCSSAVLLFESQTETR
jgi:hypothetical protein